MLGRRSPQSWSPPPALGQDGYPVRAWAYTDNGPQPLTATGLGPPQGENTLLADVGEDLVVHLPGSPLNPQQTPLDRIHGAQIVTRCRNLQIIDAQVAATKERWTLPTTSPENNNRSVYITGPSWTPGPTGSVHLERFRVGGLNWETINVRAASTAVLVLQDWKVSATLRPDGRTTSCQYLPKPGQTGAGDHYGGDVGLQLLTTPRGILIDGWLDEAASFQGPLFAKCESGQRRPDFIHLRNVASRAYAGTSWWLYFGADAGGEVCPDVRLENVVMQPAPKWVQRSDGSWVPSTQRPGLDSVWWGNAPATTSTDARVLTDRAGRKMLTHAAWLNADGTEPGVVHLRPEDVPLPDELVLPSERGYVCPTPALAA